MKNTVLKLLKNKLAVAGLVVCVIVLFVAIFAPLLYPHNPNQQNAQSVLQSPSAEYPLGTDHLGRCTLSRAIFGTRITLVVGVVAVMVSMVIGTVLGLIAGFYRGKIDTVISSVMNAIWAFPTIILALAITTALGPGLSSVVIAIGIVNAPGAARIVRSMVLSVREMEYVQAARVIGLNNREIMFRYVLPNVLPVIIVQASLCAAQAIIAEASLSFLGLGIQPPDASWGYMLKTGYPYLWTAPWLSIYPGIFIMVIVLAFNFLGDGLRDALDVRLKID